MKHTNTIFHQLLKVIPRSRFEAVVRRNHGDHRVRKLSCWQHLRYFYFTKLGGCRSLRDVVAAWGSHAGCHYHLGSGKVKRSTLADRTVLQMDQTESQDQNLLRHIRKCGQNPDHHRHDCIPTTAHGQQNGSKQSLNATTRKTRDNQYHASTRHPRAMIEKEQPGKPKSAGDHCQLMLIHV